jgi:hypothetical protein
MTRAVSISQLYSKKRKLLRLAGVWHELLGVIERKGSMIIWGQSASGKSTFTGLLVKELCRLERVLWDDFEEGDSYTLKLSFERVAMQEVRSRVVLLDKLPLADIIVVNSLQHAQINKHDYLELTRQYSTKKWIWLSHAEGKEPEGRLARFIRYDSNEKIYIEGFTAFSASRSSASVPLAFVPELAAKYHGLTFDQFNQLPTKPNNP